VSDTLVEAHANLIKFYQHLGEVGCIEVLSDEGRREQDELEEAIEIAKLKPSLCISNDELESRIKIQLALGTDDLLQWADGERLYDWARESRDILREVFRCIANEESPAKLPDEGFSEEENTKLSNLAHGAWLDSAAYKSNILDKHMAYIEGFHRGVKWGRFDNLAVKLTAEVESTTPAEIEEIFRSRVFAECTDAETVEHYVKELEENLRFYTREWVKACERDKYGKERIAELEAQIKNWEQADSDQAVALKGEIERLTAANAELKAMCDFVGATYDSMKGRIDEHDFTEKVKKDLYLTLQEERDRYKSALEKTAQVARKHHTGKTQYEATDWDYVLKVSLEALKGGGNE
jgi:hypothetical protein